MTTTTSNDAVPEHVPPGLVRDFDYHSDPGFVADPFRGFDEVRGMRAFWSTSYGGYWVLTRLADIRAAFQRPDVFSNTIHAIPPPQGWPRALIPEGVDPPAHGMYRRLLGHHFSPGETEQSATRVRSVAVDLIERIAADGSCEFLQAFGRPFPTIIFTGLLGIPVEQSDEFLQWNHDLIHSYDEAKVQAAGANIAGCIGELIEDRRRAPQDDLATAIVNGQVDGRPMTAEESLDTLFLLFMAGLDTVTATLGFAFKHLATHPQDRRRLAAEPQLVPSAVEELLRAYSIVNPARVVTTDVEFAGVRMRAGDLVLLSTSLATRDPEGFPDATHVDITRSPNSHIAFGAGPHRCLGSNLARLELQTALREWLVRIPDFELAPDAQIKAHGGGVLGIDRLPLVWPTKGGV